MVVNRPVTDPDPTISVVVPTLPEHPVNSLDPLENQRGVSYEVIIVKDDSLDICEARNGGVRQADADLIALTDDDTDRPTDWLQTAVDIFNESDIVLLEGPVRGVDGIYNRIYVGCNVAFTKAASERVGGFDLRFAGHMDDTVFGWDIEDAFGQNPTMFSPDFEISHPPEMRSSIDPEIKRLARREYSERYFGIMRQPDSTLRQLFIATASRTCHVAPPV